MKGRVIGRRVNGKEGESVELRESDRRKGSVLKGGSV